MAGLRDIGLCRRFDAARLSEHGLYGQYRIGHNVTVETPEGV